MSIENSKETHQHSIGLNNTNDFLRTFMVSILLALLTVSFLAFSASASPVTHPGLSSVQVSLHPNTSCPPGHPNSNIKGPPTMESFVPPNLTTQYGQAHYVCVTNKTKVNQQLNYNGAPFGPVLHPGNVLEIYAKSPGTVVLELAFPGNPNATLTIRFT